jgi:hypothetical protein
MQHTRLHSTIRLASCQPSVDVDPAVGQVLGLPKYKLTAGRRCFDQSRSRSRYRSDSRRHSSMSKRPQCFLPAADADVLFTARRPGRVRDVESVVDVGLCYAPSPPSDG